MDYKNMVFEAEDRAFEDADFLEEIKEFNTYYQRLTSLLHELTDEQQEIIGDFLFASARVHFLLMQFACGHGNE